MGKIRQANIVVRATGYYPWGEKNNIAEPVFMWRGNRSTEAVSTFVPKSEKLLDK